MANRRYSAAWRAVRNYKRTTDPTVEPLTLDEAKGYAKIDADYDDDTINDILIPTARIWCENYTERAFITQTWTLKLNQFPWDDSPIELEWPNLISITSFGYTDTAEASQTLTENTDFVKSTSGHLGHVRPAYGTSWPTALDDEDSVSIVYTAGYGAAASNVPVAIKHAMSLLVGHWYDNRNVIGTVGKEIEFAVTSILLPYKVFPT